MTLEQLALVACGVTVNGLTFALGMAVGVSLKRKDSRNDNDNDQAKASSSWHQPLDQQPQGGTRCRKGGCANQQPEAGAAQRAHGRRVSDR